MNIEPYFLFLINLAALVAYMTVVFSVALRRKRIDTVDAAWGGAFVVATVLVAGLQPNPLTITIAVLTNIWAVRLSSHIIERARKSEDDDPRYVAIAKKWGKDNYWPRAYVSIFMVQAVAAALVSVPAVFAAGELHDYYLLFLGLGIAVWILGFVTELVGDRQLKRFLADTSNKGKVLERGLWKYTRHPNYLGEITQWYGIGIIACGAGLGFIGLVGPIILNILIRFISGVPPIERRKSKDPQYAAYMKRTNALVPRFKRLTS